MIDCAKPFLWWLVPASGILLAVLGAALTAPGGTFRLLQRIGRAVQRGLRSTVEGLKRVLPFWPEKHRTVVSADSLNLESSLGAVRTHARGAGHAWEPDASTEHKFDLLRAQIDKLREGLARYDQIIREEQRVRAREIADLQSKLESRVDGLEEDLDRERERAVEIDARGLPVIVFAIIIAEIPVLACEYWLVWPVVVGATAVSAWPVRRLFQQSPLAARH